MSRAVLARAGHEVDVKVDGRSARRPGAGIGQLVLHVGRRAVDPTSLGLSDEAGRLNFGNRVVSEPERHVRHDAQRCGAGNHLLLRERAVRTGMQRVRSAGNQARRGVVRAGRNGNPTGTALGTVPAPRLVIMPRNPAEIRCRAGELAGDRLDGKGRSDSSVNFPSAYQHVQRRPNQDPGNVPSRARRRGHRIIPARESKWPVFLSGGILLRGMARLSVRFECLSTFAVASGAGYAW